MKKTLQNAQDTRIERDKLIEKDLDKDDDDENFTDKSNNIVHMYSTVQRKQVRQRLCG